MTEPDDSWLGTALRDTVIERVDRLDPPAADVYEQVRRRHRRSRRRTVALAAVVTALTAVGVPLAVTGDRAAAPAPPATEPADPVRSVTRGSLAGDDAAIAAAITLLTGAAGADRVDPGTVRVPYAGQADGHRLVLVTGVLPATGEVRAVFATGAPGEPLRPGGSIDGPAEPGVAGPDGQQVVAPERVLARVAIGDRSYGLALFPPGSSATIRRGAAVGADCRRSEGPAVELPLVDGAALFPIGADDAPYVEVTDGRRSTGRALPPTGPRAVSEPEIAAELAGTLRGEADPGLAAGLARHLATTGVATGVGERPQRWIGVWAGPLPGGGVAALVGARYASGATVLQGLASAAGGYRGWLAGCVPARALGRVVVVARLTNRPGGPLVVVAPARAVRADIRLATGGLTTVDLDEGGGIYRGGGTVTGVEGRDAAGGPVGSGVPGGVNDIVPLPIPR